MSCVLTSVCLRSSGGAGGPGPRGGPRLPASRGVQYVYVRGVTRDWARARRLALRIWWAGSPRVVGGPRTPGGLSNRAGPADSRQGAIA